MEISQRDHGFSLIFSPFSELYTQWEITYKYTLQMADKDFIIKYNRNLTNGESEDYKLRL